MIDPALDGWVWGTAVLFLALMGARAWVVETGVGRLGRTPVKVRALTGAVVVALGALAVLLVVQGGAQLAEALITGDDPVSAEEDPEPGSVLDDDGAGGAGGAGGADDGVDDGVDDATGGVADDGAGG